MRAHGRSLRFSLVAALVTATFTGVAASATPAAPAAPALNAATVNAHGSAEQVYVTGAQPGAKLELLDTHGRAIAGRTVNALGGALFRSVKPGTGYRVKVLPNGPTSAPVTVHSTAPKQWNPSIYKQPIKDDGYGYMTTRDGTQLAYRVWLPSELGGAEGTPPITIPGGAPAYSSPYPVLVEYSGYAYADPKGPTSGIAALANIMGFAVVDIQMRGTGCSGGAFDFFEPLQSLDGYDIIETFARQPWVRKDPNGKPEIGMFGISYGGISQLFTAATQPPSLQAIAPLSVIDATATTLYPGGIRNDGFAVNWAKERQAQAQPAGAPGTQPYAQKQIDAGDEVCKANQALHPEAADLLAKIRANQHYKPAVADPLDPVSFVHKIKVPVFMACQWEDEQTGGHCPTLAEHMTGTTKKWFTFTNGPHIDSLAPATYNRLYDFVSIYVAHQSPSVYAAQVQASAPVVYQAAMGVPQNDSVTLPPDPIQADPTYDTAKADFEKLPSVRILFDNGAGSGPPDSSSNDGDPYPQFEKSFASFPIPGTKAQRWYLGPSGALTDGKPKAKGVNSYTSNPHALPLTDFGKDTGGGGLWGNASQWEWNWKPNPAGTAVSYISAPLTKDTAVVGAGAVDLWVRSSTPDVDLMVTVSEVTPGNKETFVQNGYLRASERKLDPKATNIMKRRSSVLEPVPSMRASDVQRMPKKKFVKLTVPLYYEGHMYRKGTRIRITIAAPNGTQPIWSFSHTMPGKGTSKVAVAFAPKMPSSLVLPVVPDVTTTTPQPPCPSLRNEPCRDYVAVPNK